jgi:hypothetical protein
MSISSHRAAIGLLAATVLMGAAGGAADAQIAVIERPMPAPIVEVVPPVPHPGYSWVPGHYAWRVNHWQWVRGHYIAGVVAPMPVAVVETAPPSPGPGWFWVRGHYVWERSGWAWHGGHWYH